MNKLEFRAWHKGISYIFSKPYLLAEYTVLSFAPEDEKLNGIDRLGYDDFEFDCIEQYTGLKDKNGKKIYEGDIIKEYWQKTGNKVIFSNGSCGFFDDSNYFHLLSEVCDLVKVVGNIHENPELLGKQL